jgi:MFS family permease
MILGWASLVCGVLWGWTADAIGRKWAMMIIFLIQSVAYALFALWTDTAGLVISAVMFGITAWGIPSIMAVVCGDIMGPVMAPAAYGFLTFFHGLGQSTGPYVAGRMADALPSFTPSYLMASAVAFAGAIGILLYRGGGAPRKKQQKEDVCPSDVLDVVPPL